MLKLTDVPVVLMLASVIGCKDHSERSEVAKIDSVVSTADALAAVPTIASPAPNRADINQCRREDFYERISAYVDHYTQMYHNEPKKDAYETYDEFYQRLGEWMGSPTPSHTPDLVDFYVRVPVEHAHYDADREWLFIDSIAELQVPAVTVDGHAGRTTYAAMSCAAYPWFSCRGFEYWRDGSNTAVSYGRRLRVMQGAGFSIPRDSARATDIVNQELALDLYFVPSQKTVPPIREDVPSMRIRNDDLPIFAPEIRLDVVHLVADHKPTSIAWQGGGNNTGDPANPSVYAPIMEMFSSRPRQVSEACRSILRGVPDTFDANPPHM